MKNIQYPEQKFQLGTLSGLSERQIEQHLMLYAGYVKNTNLVIEQISEARKAGKINDPQSAELRRRLGWEFNGMRLHELYFAGLGGSRTAFNAASALGDALVQGWGSYEAWLAEFKGMGMMRGIGWVLLTQDLTTGHLINHWVSEHEIGHLAEGRVVIAMDVWEHAYTVDFAPTQRKDYIEKYCDNLNWSVFESRFTATNG